MGLPVTNAKLRVLSLYVIDYGEPVQVVIEINSLSITNIFNKVIVDADF
jgi:hypothetical protein